MSAEPPVPAVAQPGVPPPAAVSGPAAPLADRRPGTGGTRFRRFLTGLDYGAAALFAVIIFWLLLVVRHPAALREISSWPLGWLSRAFLAAALAAATCFPVAIRRRYPGTALAIVLGGCAAILALGGVVTAGPVLPLALVLYMVAATSLRPAAIYGLAAALALMAMEGVRETLAGIGAGNAVAAALFLIIVWTVGFAVRQRRAYTARLREQQASQIAAAAVTEERLRIARELHDVVAHSMTVAAVQAGFGEYVFDSQPAKARAALGAIQTVTRDALADMQRLLGVLRHAGPPSGTMAAGALAEFSPALPPGAVIADGEPAAAPAARSGATAAAPAWLAGQGSPPTAPLRPAPGLADLDRLVAATAGAGVAVTVQRTGQVRRVAAGADLSAFRIVQEALTNVVKHSGASSCRVSIGYTPAALSVEVTDPGPDGSGRPGGRGGPGGPPAVHSSPRAGHGLVGMRERVSLCGGDFSAAPLPGAGFRVWARLPLAGGEP